MRNILSRAGAILGIRPGLPKTVPHWLERAKSWGFALVNYGYAREKYRAKYDALDHKAGALGPGQAVGGSLWQLEVFLADYEKMSRRYKDILGFYLDAKDELLSLRQRVRELEAQPPVCKQSEAA